MSYHSMLLPCLVASHPIALRPSCLDASMPSCLHAAMPCNLEAFKAFQALLASSPCALLPSRLSGQVALMPSCVDASMPSCLHASMPCNLEAFKAFQAFFASSPAWLQTQSLRPSKKLEKCQLRIRPKPHDSMYNYGVPFSA